MLPILRVLPAGGVLLALLILVLALKTPGVRPLPADMIEARGPLLDRHEHPEWRQISTQAALRRAAELVRLRDLPDAAPRTGGTNTLPVPAETATSPESSIAAGATRPTDKAPDDDTHVAGLPGPGNDTSRDDDIVTGSVDEPAATMPVEIGEASAFELPVLPAEERLPVIRTPEKVQPPTESHRKPARRKSRTKAAPPQTPPNPLLSFLEMLFKGSESSENRYPSAPQ